METISESMVIWNYFWINGDLVLEISNFLHLHLKMHKIFPFSLRKIPYFHLISWCGNFVERYSFCKVSGKSLGDVKNSILLAHNWFRSSTFPQNFHNRKLDEITVFYSVFQSYHKSSGYYEHIMFSPCANYLQLHQGVCKTVNINCLHQIFSRPFVEQLKVVIC